MRLFKYIDMLEKDIEEAFKEFYETMLSDTRLGVFFDSQEQVDALIQKQKEYFRASLHMDKSTLKKVYVKLGEYHYDIRIPYIDFIKGADILEEHFLMHSHDISNSNDLMEEILYYFKIMKSYTAKGYLNRMIQQDQKDIDLFFNQTLEKSDDDYLPKQVIFKKIEWLKNLLNAIEKSEDFEIDANSALFTDWINLSDNISPERKEMYLEIENRIFIDAQNLFFFLYREEYLEILPLYSSLLNIYKLTLILNNALTVDYASQVIDHMKTDPMTGLFRKEIFKELLKKKIAFLKRNPDRIFSIIYLDIDDFKNINDRYGHYSGDKVIENLGKIIKKNIRASDLGFRIGGDEFAIILEDANLKNAQKVGKKILYEFAEAKYKFNEEINFNSTLSIGIVEVNDDKDLDEEKLIKEVDNKLYISKENGKNQISV
jgi:diguanylate cyclase (GGDEF)-like protein